MEVTSSVLGPKGPTTSTSFESSLHARNKRAPPRAPIDAAWKATPHRERAEFVLTLTTLCRCWVKEGAPELEVVAGGRAS